MNRLVMVTLRVLLIILILTLLAAEGVIAIYGPGAFASDFSMTPETNYGNILLIILALVCVQVALVMVWRLLSMVSSGQVFTRRALRELDMITLSAAGATVVALGFTIVLGVRLASHMAGFENSVILRISLMLAQPAAYVVAGMAVVLFLIVMRSVLKAATTKQHELVEVADVI